MDRLLGEHGIGHDSVSGCHQFEQQMQARRLEETDAEALQALRRGWYVGRETFRTQMLERMEGKLGDHHSGQLHH